MSVITNIPEPNVFDQICEEFDSRRHLYADQRLPIEVNYDASKHTPVFFGPLHKRVVIDGKEDDDFDASISHPACIGYAFVEKSTETPPPLRPSTPNKHRCSPREYLESYVFPLLLPALEELLRQAKLEKCFERKRTKFNAGDFLTEYLYKNNPMHQDRGELCLADIPFVQEWWTEHPRAPLPKSLLWTEQEALLVVQNFWRGYKVREEETVQELRRWQKECRRENQSIHETVNRFWADKIPSDHELEIETNEPGQPDQQQQIPESSDHADDDHFVSLSPTDGISKDVCDKVAYLTMLA